MYMDRLDYTTVKKKKKKKKILAIQYNKGLFFLHTL